jgi:cyclic pyranopterin phosphate synthase
MSALAVRSDANVAADMLGRPLRDLRISVTDRCNFRCTYCMPKSHFGPGHRFLPRAEVLQTDEIVRLVDVFVSLGVTKVRLTGGEPLLRADLDEIVRGVASGGVADVALTTNGALLEHWAARLRDAGLRRVTVSLDSLDPVVFAAMSDTRVDVGDVVRGIAAAGEAGLQPVKVNCVVRRGVNDTGVLDLVEFARREGLVLRFIEYMDVGSSNGWRMDDVVPGEEILATISRSHALEELASEPGAVARRYRFRDGGGELGVIMSVSRPFCGDCTRARLGVDGRLFTCLFATEGLDRRGPLRAGADDDELRRLIAARWQRRDDRYSELRQIGVSAGQRIEMSYIGG